MSALLLVLSSLGLLSSPLFAQEDPSGNWAARFHEDNEERGPGPELNDYAGIPINAADRLRADSWDAALVELQENQCRVHGSDCAWRGPGGLMIWKEVDRVTQELIAYHTHIGAWGNEQTIYMDGRPHPPEYASHSWQGFTTGEWQGDILSATTDHLKENWIRRNGIARSEKATVTTHFLRHGEYLTVVTVVYDPAYLSASFIRSTDFAYDPRQVVLQPYPCEAVEEVNREEGVIPNHLPGQNPFINEYAAKYGVPPEATRGGAETMYPEYELKLKNMKRLPPPPPPANPVQP